MNGQALDSFEAFKEANMRVLRDFSDHLSALERREGDLAALHEAVNGANERLLGLVSAQEAVLNRLRATSQALADGLE
ncbi:hypothetical protein GMRT_jh018 [Giardia muris]|uniref:Uncharacterized protein n=1 Tax=Giardia muris TaxID=5742 RepID=A0A4Z1T1P3_GIAMU|nr:hypothetical protein GMRT_jh018 [Giardia muris]|eukprot:TNJ26291.1 hypothetical protein GMRT_jh018 [Giardia muris]